MSLRVPNDEPLVVDAPIAGRPYQMKSEVQCRCYECGADIRGRQWLASVGYGSGGYRFERYICLECWQQNQPDTARINLALMRALNANRAAGVDLDEVDDAATLMLRFMVVENKRVRPNAALCAIFDRYGAP